MTVTEPLPFVDAVRRTLEIEDQGEHVRAALTLTTNLAPAPAQIWSLLASRAQLVQWYGQLDDALVEGERFRVRGSAVAPDAQGRVLELVEPHKILLTFENQGTDDPVQIRIDPEDDGTTRLRLTHTTLIGRDAFHRVGAGAAALHWEIAVMALASHTGGWSAGGSAVPMPTSQWLDGADGMAHLQAWSVRWAGEALAAGVDEDSARRGEIETPRAFHDEAGPQDQILTASTRGSLPATSA